MKLRVLAENHPNYVGDVREYRPWPHDWQGMSEPERVAKGIYVNFTTDDRRQGKVSFDVFLVGNGQYSAFTPAEIIEE